MHITVDVASGQPRTRELDARDAVPHHLRGRRRAGPLDSGAARSCRAPMGEELEERWAARRADLRAEVEAAMAGQVYTACRDGARASSCASSPRRPTSTGAARCTAASSCGGSTRRPTCWRPSGPGATQNVAIFTGGVRFYRPLRIGHVVEVEARLLHTGRTSMHVGVHVRSGDPAAGAGRHGADDLLPHRSSWRSTRSAGRCRAPRGCRPTTRTGPWTPTPSSWSASASASATDLVPTFPPDPGSFTFAPEPFRCDGEGSRTRQVARACAIDDSV